MRLRRLSMLTPVVCGVLASGAMMSGVGDVQPVVRTQSVADDPDDPAIWIHPTDPGRSLIIGTNKVKAPGGALVVFGLDGVVRQTVAGLDRPNNVDVEYGLVLDGTKVDIAVATERLKHQLRVFRVAAGGITDITSVGRTRVLEGRTDQQAEP